MFCKISVALAALLAAAAALPAAADPARSEIVEKVSYADLDLSRVEGVATLSVRLSRAIDKVCGRPHDTASLTIRSKIKACRTQQMDMAVASIDVPLLTALHKGGAGEKIAGL